MTTRAILINVTAATTSTQILDVLRDHYHKAFSGGGIYPAAGPYTGYGVVYDDITANNRFFVKTDTCGNGSGDEIAYLEIGIASNKLYHRIAEGFTGTALSGAEALTGGAATWATDFASAAQYRGHYCTLYFGESFVIYAAADRGFSWFNVKSQYGLQYPAVFTGFDRTPADLVDLSTKVSKSTRFGRLASGGYLEVPRLGGVPAGGSSSTMVITHSAIYRSGATLRIFSEPIDAEAILLNPGPLVSRLSYPEIPQRDLGMMRCTFDDGLGSSVKHPDTAAVDNVNGILYDFGYLKASVIIAGTITVDAVLPSVVAPQYLVTPRYLPASNISYGHKWAVPVLYSL